MLHSPALTAINMPRPWFRLRAGADTYRRATPAFLGLVLDGVTMMVFWLLIDCWQGRTNHGLLPG